MISKSVSLLHGYLLVFAYWQVAIIFLILIDSIIFCSMTDHMQNSGALPIGKSHIYDWIRIIKIIIIIIINGMMYDKCDV